MWHGPLVARRDESSTAVDTSAANRIKPPIIVSFLK